MRVAAVLLLSLTGLLGFRAEAKDRKPHPADVPEKVVVEPPPVAPPKPEPEPAPAALMAPKGPIRVDFDDRLLQGQTNRLGAVYLYQRKEPVQPSLLDRHKSFRTEIRRDLLE